MGVLRATMQRMWDDAERAYRVQILELVRSATPRNLLDVGCDDGAWTARLAGQAGLGASAVSGIEIVPERREAALRRGYDVRAADLDERWPFDDERFDLVHANQVIEHVHHLDHFVAETHRVLRPGGRMLVCTENLASWHNIAGLVLGYMPFSLTNISTTGSVGNRLALHAGAEVTRPDTWLHTRVLTLVGLRSILIAHGFLIVRSFASGYHPATGALAATLARRDPRHAHFIGAVALR